MYCPNYDFFKIIITVIIKTSMYLFKRNVIWPMIKKSTLLNNVNNTLDKEKNSYDLNMIEYKLILTKLVESQSTQNVFT